jgi:hypothetical protein
MTDVGKAAVRRLMTGGRSWHILVAIETIRENGRR